MDLPEHELEALGKRAAAQWSARSEPSYTLTRATVEQVKQAGGKFNRDQLERITSYANRHGYLDQHHKLGSNHRYVHFDGGPARADEVIKQATGVPEPVTYRSLDDYRKPPPSYEKKASWEELFGVTKFAFSQDAEDPWEHAKKLEQDLHHAVKQAASTLDMEEMSLSSAKYRLVQQMKIAHEDGASLRDVVRALGSVSPDPVMMKNAFSLAHETLMRAGNHSPATYAESLKTASVMGRANPEHPLPQSYREYLQQSEKLAATRQVFSHLRDKLAELRVGIKEAAATPAAVAAEKTPWSLGKLVRGGLDAVGQAGDYVSHHGAQFGKDLSGEGSVAHFLGQHSGKAIKALPYVAAAGIGLRGYQHAQAAYNSPMAQKVMSFIPGTDANEYEQMRIQQAYSGGGFGGGYGGSY